MATYQLLSLDIYALYVQSVAPERADFFIGYIFNCILHSSINFGSQFFDVTIRFIDLWRDKSLKSGTQLEKLSIIFTFQLSSFRASNIFFTFD